ncbi:MAG: M14 family metallopeptidase, partial [Candidatus Methanomethylicia archaeon]
KTIIIIPMLNPDGTEMTKYSPPKPSVRLKDGRCNANGVDLNRNFGYAWSSGGSPYYNSTTYRGEKPETEPEVKALLNILSNKNIVFYLNLHSGVKQVIIPAYQSNPYINVYNEIASLISSIYGYEIVKGGLYGGSANWCLMARNKPAPSIIIELYGGGNAALEMDWFLFYNPIDINEINKIETLSYQTLIQILKNAQKWSETITQKQQIQTIPETLIIAILAAITITLAVIIAYKLLK